ncbi:HNH endonuclease [Candidatus Poriferisodalis sp.]|uniref:HNH endonuclease n=1 Tax=Candidatus Poriferisodalis sp. TaxID=3101277 RepID=UPI003B0198D3
MDSHTGNLTDEYLTYHLENYLDQLSRPSKSTRQAYRGKLREWFRYALDAGVDPASPDDQSIENFREVLVQRVQPGTARSYISYVRRWRKYCVAMDLTAEFSEDPSAASFEPRAWVVRAGRNGEQVQPNLDNGAVTIEWIGWDAIRKVYSFSTRDSFGEFIKQNFSDEPAAAQRSARDQIWDFYHQIRVGDVVVMPLTKHGGTRDWIAIGRVIGAAHRDESYPPGAQHRRAVEWLTHSAAKTHVQAELRKSIDRPGTVRHVTPPGSPARLIHLVEHGLDPGPGEEAQEVPDDRRASGPARRSTWVLTWNRSDWDMDEEHYQHNVSATARGEPVLARWSTGTRKSGIRRGDNVVLFVHGPDGGIIATGQTTSDSDGSTAWIDVAWSDWTTPEDGLPIEALREIAPNFFRRSIRASGWKLSADDAAAVMQAWTALQDDSLQAPLIEIEAGLEADVGADEGASYQSVVTKFKRSRWLRQRSIQINGKRCKVCNMSFADRYGEFARDYIHVHHLTPISAGKGKSRKVNARKDLIPVCANCHFMLHYGKKTPRTEEELRQLICEAPEANRTEETDTRH